MPKIAILNTHPIQYFAPLYSRLAQEPDIDLTVYFCSRQGVDAYHDEGFDKRFKWDVPLTEGYKSKFLKNLRVQGRVGGFWSLINPEIISELHRHSYDALIVNGHNHATYLMAMLFARLFGTAVLMRCDTHLLLRRSPIKRALRKPLLKILYNRICSGCLPIGTRNQHFYESFGVSKQRLTTVPFAVDNDFFMSTVQQFSNKAEIREQLCLSEKPVILFASKLTPRKRPMDLLVAFHELQNLGIDAALAFVGDGELRSQLQEYVALHALKDVHFFGFQNQSELPKFYASADVFVLPSENEPWGLILNEAMCAGLPIIASKEIGAVPDLIREGRNGFLFDGGDINQLVEHLSNMVMSSERRASMGRESLRIIAEWNFDACVRGIKAALVRPRFGVRALDSHSPMSGR